METLEDLKRTIAEITTEQKRLKDENRDLREGLDQKTTEIKTAMQAHEAALQEARRYQATGNDADVVRAYTGDDAKTVKHGRPVDASTRDVGLAYDRRHYLVHKDYGAIKMLGCEDQDGSFSYGLLDDPEPKSHWQHELQKAVDLRSWVRRQQDPRRVRSKKCDRRFADLFAKGPGAIGQIGKVFADNAGEGGEWIPDLVQPELYRKMENARRLEALFPTFELRTGGTTTNPYLTTGARPYKYDAPATGDMDPADFTGSVPSTADRTVTPSGIATYIPVDRDALEDSLINFAAYGQRLLIEAHNDGTEDAILNGDITASHGDTGIAGWDIRDRWGTAGLGGSGDHRRVWTGLRHRAIDVSTNVDGSSAETAAGIAAWRTQMTGAYAKDVIAVTSLEWIFKKLIVDTNLMTVDKYGALATLVTGEVARVFGIPILVSDFMDIELNASGIYDDSTKTKTGLVLFNRMSFEMGIRRTLRVETQLVPRNNRIDMVSSERKKFHTWDAAATKNCAYAYNLTP